MHAYHYPPQILSSNCSPKRNKIKIKKPRVPIPSQYSNNNTVSLPHTDFNNDNNIDDDDHDPDVMTHLNYLINMTQTSQYNVQMYITTQHTVQVCIITHCFLVMNKLWIYLTAVQTHMLEAKVGCQLHPWLDPGSSLQSLLALINLLLANLDYQSSQPSPKLQLSPGNK